MDAERFDAIARNLIAATNRRRTLGALLGAAFSLRGLAALDAGAARSGRCKPKCGPCETCNKGDCKRKNGKKRCKKVKCQLKATGSPCTAFPGGVCQNGTCVNVKADETNCGSLGNTCGPNQVCQDGSCFPSSTCPATFTSYCTPPFGAVCGAGATCFCARSAEGNVVCLLDEDEACMGSAPLCETSADCPSGEACVDFNGCCAADPAGSKRCLARCPSPAA